MLDGVILDGGPENAQLLLLMEEQAYLWLFFMLSEVKILKVPPKKNFKCIFIMKLWRDLEFSRLQTAGITVTQVVHDKDASTMRHVMTVYEDVEELLCLSNC